MEVNPISNILPAPISDVQANFRKEQIALIDNDIKAKSDKAAIEYTDNVKNYIHDNTSVNPLAAFSDNKIKFNDFNIDVREAYKPLNNGGMVSMFDNFIKGTNNEQRFAEAQSTSEKWGNGALKLLGKTSTAILGGTVGSVNGVLQWAKTGSFESSYNNNLNDWLDDLNTKMEYKLPNYYTEQEKSNNFGQNLGSANFWANDVLGGLSFTLGTIASEALWAWGTGGTSLGTTAARLGSRLRVGRLSGEVAETAVAMNRVNALSKAPVLERYLTGKIPQDLAIKFGKAGELVNTARFVYTSAGFESGQEARHYMREAKDEYLSSFSKMNGRQPTGEEYNQFEKNLTDSANSLFAFNMAIVGSSNLAIFGKTLGINSPIKFPTKWANSTFFGIGSKFENGALVALSPTRVQSLAAKSFSVLKTPLTEGLYEEGMQSVGNNTAKNWIKSTYDPKYMGNTMDLGTSFVEGLGQTYGSKEGWKEIGIGMIIGLLSGTGMSVARGQGLFGELDLARRNNEAEVDIRNKYTVEKTLDRIHTANRVAAFTEASEIAEEKGDLTGAELSRSSAMIAHINGAYNFGYTDQALQEFKAGVNSMDNDLLIKQYGLESQEEAESLKETLFTEYSDLTKEYSKQRDYVNYMIDARSTEFNDIKNLNEVKEALAYELTIGGKAYDFSQELLTDIKNSLAKNYNTAGQSMSSAVEVQDILWSASKEVRDNFTTKQKELKASKLEKDRLEKERLSLEKSKNSKEDNTADLNRLNSVVVDIENNLTETQRLERELEGVISAAQLQNPYNNNEQPFITAEELVEVDSNLSSISKLVEDFKDTNPREGYRLEGVIKEYQKSKTAFIRYADLARQLQDPRLGLRGKRNIISELSSDKSPSEITLEFVQGMSSNMDRIREQETLEQTESTTEFREALAAERRQRMQSPLQTTVSTVQDIINDNPYLFEYVGTADNIRKPTEEELSEYKSLMKRVVSSRTIDNDIATSESPFFYSFNNRKIRMTPSEFQRFQELNQLMSDWRFYQGAFNSEGISIADLIEQELSREEGATAPEVQDELTVDDFVSVSTPEEVIPGKNSEFRKSSIIQTYENIKVTVRDNNYEFSHLKISSILDRIPSISKIVMQLPVIDEFGVVQSWGKATEVGLQQVLDNQKYGTKFVISTDEGNMQINIMDFGRIQIPIIDFNRFKNTLEWNIFKQVTTRSSFSDLYELNEEGDFVQKESDFGQEDGEAVYTPEEVLEAIPGTNTFFKINIQDPYNRELKERFDNDEIDFNTIINQVKVYNTGVNGKILGDLKSNKDIVDETDNFLEIRRMAAELLVDKIPAQDVVTIPYTAKAAYVLLGTPNITMINTEDGVIPNSIVLTSKALERVEDYGFIKNGTLQLKGKTKGVRLDFVSKLARKSDIPVIVFKEGSYYVAYPVTLVKRSTDKTLEVNEILNDNSLNKANKATLINSILSENNINPNLEYKTSEIQNMYNEDGSISTVLQGHLDTLLTKREFVDVNEWLDKNHNKENLVQDITLTINLEERVLKSPKLIIDFSKAERNDFETPWYDNWVSTGEISDEQINIIANKTINFESLSNQETDVYNNERERIKEAVKNIVNIPDNKQNIADNKQNKDC